jgi:hypothetical protein
LFTQLGDDARVKLVQGWMDAGSEAEEKAEEGSAKKEEG